MQVLPALVVAALGAGLVPSPPSRPALAVGVRVGDGDVVAEQAADLAGGQRDELVTVAVGYEKRRDMFGAAARPGATMGATQANGLGERRTNADQPWRPERACVPIRTPSDDLWMPTYQMCRGITI